MKVAIFTWGLSGGAFANIAAALAKGFWNLGVRELSVIYLSHGRGRHINFPEGVRLVSLGVQRARWAPFALARFLREAKPDVLISMPTYISIVAILGYLLTGRNRTKLIVNQADTLSSDIYIEHRYDLRMRSLPWLARLLYPRADGIVAISEGVLDILRQTHISIRHSHLAVIPGPVDLESIATQANAEPDHPWLQKKQGPVIVSLGRLVKRKNFPLLIEALAIVRKRVDAKLVIFGEGPERKDLENLALKLDLEHVSLPGYSQNPWSNITRADVFAMPSVDEAFCLALVEAMACGARVVATDAIGGGPRSILENGRYGFLVPNGDSKALADAILKVISSRDLRDRLVVSGKQRCEAFRPEIVAQRWISFIEELSS